MGKITDGKLDRSTLRQKYTLGPGDMFLESLLNLRIGNPGGNTNYAVSFRFLAEESGPISTLYLYFILAAGGYYGGDGGVVSINLAPSRDDGTPDCDRLTEVARERFTQTDFDRKSKSGPYPVNPGYQVQAGRIYHVVMIGVGDRASENFASIETCTSRKAGAGPVCRWIDSSLWACLLTGNYNGNATNWIDLTKNGDQTKWAAPVLGFTINGKEFGMTAQESGMTRERICRLKAGQHMIDAWRSSKDMRVCGMSYLLHLGAGADIDIRISSNNSVVSFNVKSQTETPEIDQQIGRSTIIRCEWIDMQARDDMFIPANQSVTVSVFCNSGEVWVPTFSNCVGSLIRPIHWQSSLTTNINGRSMMYNQRNHATEPPQPNMFCPAYVLHITPEEGFYQ